MEDKLTPERIDALAAEIDKQLRELGSEDATGAGLKGHGADPLAKQREDIERATGEDADSYLKRFRAKARRDLCEDGGLLYTQWKKFQDFTSKDAAASFSAVLLGMGLAANALNTAVVAIGVWVIHVGLEAFCDEKD